MGVQNLWKALAKGDAVQQLDGSRPGEHAAIVEALEHKVVAVDLSAWLMQAQTQPALQEHYDSPLARAAKVVFDRTIHWLRYGCLPVFVIEGRTPAAKLDKLRARCIAQYGPAAAAGVGHGNRAGSQFDQLGQAVKRLLDAFGVPCVQAEGEGEAMCAALNLCGWAHAAHSLDVDALLFGAVTVLRNVHLQTDDPRRSVLTRCCMADVRRVLGLQRGGDAALMAVAHLAGGDYDMVGAEQVGEALALGAVRCLLRGCADDAGVLARLQAAVAAGPDPELDALTKCTGCKACGHEGGCKSRITKHTARSGACAACGADEGCVPRDWERCGCAFHARSDERLLNRVVRRAAGTPHFLESFRTAAAAYADQTRSAIAAVQREYGLPVPGADAPNVFTWRHRPDVRAISDIMSRYIKDWSYHQVRLKLLPLLLEWDVRQGPPALLPPSAAAEAEAAPAAAAAAGVQFRPTGIRKVSSKGADAAANTGLPVRQQHGWRYVLLVERIQQQQQQVSSPAAAAGGRSAAADEAQDLEIDLAWLAGTARSKPPKTPAKAASTPAKATSTPSRAAPAVVAAAAAAAATAIDSESNAKKQQQQSRGLGAFAELSWGLDDADEQHYEGEAFLATQMPPSTQATPPRPSQPSRSQQATAAAAAAAAASPGAASQAAPGSLQFSEHRSVRCSLMKAAWPELVARFRNPGVNGGGSSSRPRSSSAAASGRGRRKKAAGAGAAAAAAAAADEAQRSLKDFYGIVKDYTASGPGRQALGSSKPAGGSAAAAAAASGGGLIPGLSGLTAGGRPSSGSSLAVVAAAAAASGSGGSSRRGRGGKAGSGRGKVQQQQLAATPPGKTRGPMDHFLHAIAGSQQSPLAPVQQQQREGAPSSSSPPGSSDLLLGALDSPPSGGADELPPPLAARLAAQTAAAAAAAPPAAKRAPTERARELLHSPVKTSPLMPPPPPRPSPAGLSPAAAAAAAAGAGADLSSPFRGLLTQLGVASPGEAPLQPGQQQQQLGGARKSLFSSFLDEQHAQLQRQQQPQLRQHHQHHHHQQQRQQQQPVEVIVLQESPPMVVEPEGGGDAAGPGGGAARPRRQASAEVIDLT